MTNRANQEWPEGTAHQIDPLSMPMLNGHVHGWPTLFAQHPLQGVLHAAPQEVITWKCPSCRKQFNGPVRQVHTAYHEHVLDAHFDELEDCGCCGGYHFAEFFGDCREDWERF